MDKKGETTEHKTTHGSFGNMSTTICECRNFNCPIFNFLYKNFLILGKLSSNVQTQRETYVMF